MGYRMSDCCLTPTRYFFNNNFQSDDDDARFVLDQHDYLDLIVLAHWNNSLRIDMLHHSDTLS